MANSRSPQDFVIQTYTARSSPDHRARATNLPLSCPLSCRVCTCSPAQEPFFLDNATQWAAALRDAGTDVVMHERDGSHGAKLWRAEFPLMVAWAFGSSTRTTR